MSETERPSGSLPDLLCGLSFASSVNMGNPMEHGLRTAYIGLRLADGLGLPNDDATAVFYGALLKDSG